MPARRYKLSAHTLDARKNVLSYTVKSNEGGTSIIAGAVSRAGLPRSNGMNVSCAVRGLWWFQKNQDKCFSVVQRMMRGKRTKVIF